MLEISSVLADAPVDMLDIVAIMIIAFTVAAAAGARVSIVLAIESVR